ncbi:MAG: CheR family methyltransferase [Desulfococcaceae bacterium]
MHLISAELSEKQFRKIAQLVYSLCGINLKDGKQALVRARLMKRLRALKMIGFDEYMDYIESEEGQGELSFMVDVMTTNKTHFFREPEHFNYLCDHILPKLNRRRMRFWTAACSSGEEPFSLAILLREHIQEISCPDIRILATDISMRMLERARQAVYGEEVLRDVPPMFLQKYFTKRRQSGGRQYQLKEEVRRMVQLAWLNLMDPWPMKGPFDVIFCRNVMIYFDRQTQQRLINRFWALLDSGGYLFVGHSEGLSAVQHKFRYVRPAVYRK